MALNNLGLGFVFTAKNLASGTIKKLDRDLGRLSGNTSKTSSQIAKGLAIATAGVIPLAIGLGGLATSLSLADASANFSQGIQRVGNISGATSEELNQLRDAAIEAGLRTQFSPDQSVEGLANLAAQGFNASQSINLLNTSLNLAAGGQIGIADATAATAAAVRVFNIQGEAQLGIADRLLKITNQTALQAQDLTLALGTVSRGAGLTNQSLNEMLISMGLVRNAGIDVSVAASSVSSALQFAAKNSKKFTEDLGVSVTDQSGNFRDFLDIVAEADASLSKKYTNAAEKATAATELFGRFGVTAFQNISTQLHQMVETRKDINSVTEAIAVMRKEMADAEGTAQEFADKLLDTFAGQKTILQGAVETLAVVLGEPFAQVFKPIVKLLADTVSFIARSFNSLPKELKTTIATIFVVGSALTAVIGAMTVLAGLVTAVLPFLAAFKAVFAVIAAGAATAAAVFAGWAAVFVLVREAYRRNLGGLADFIDNVVSKVSLAWKGLTQLFSQGGFTGAVQAELGKAENEGVKSFVIGIGAAIHRVVRFFQSIGKSFSEGFEKLGPVIGIVIQAFGEIGDAVAKVWRQWDIMVNGVKSSTGDFEATGATIGDVLIGIVKGIAYIISFAATMTAAFINAFATAQEFGSSIADFFRVVATRIGQAFLSITDVFMNMIDDVLIFISGIVSKIPDSLRPSSLDFLGSEDFRKKLETNKIERNKRIASNSSVADSSVAQIEADAEIRRGITNDIIPQLQTVIDKRDEKPIVVDLKVDGTKIASATAKAQRKENARGFVPAPSGVE